MWVNHSYSTLIMNQTFNPTRELTTLHMVNTKPNDNAENVNLDMRYLVSHSLAPSNCWITPLIHIHIHICKTHFMHIILEDDMTSICIACVIMKITFVNFDILHLVSN